MKILYGVGVGPGDPELMTLKAVKTIQKVDYVFVPRTRQDTPGMAETVAADSIEGKSLVYLHFPMGPETQEMYTHAAEIINATLQDGESGAFLTIGDPLVYSTYTYVMLAAQQFGIEHVVIPGVTSYQAAAATLHMPVTTKHQRFYLADGYIDEAVLDNVDSLCIVKPSKDKANTLAILNKHGFQYACVSRCSLPEETILNDDDGILKNRDYMSLIYARKR